MGRKTISDNDVIKIRAVYESGGISVREVARRFDISPRQAGRIIRKEQRKKQIRRVEY